MLSALRLKVFQSALRPLSLRARARRMRLFAHRLRVRTDASIVDLGGQPKIWGSLSESLNITIVNLPGVVMDAYPSQHKFTVLRGDACDVTGIENGAFDIAFSNGVIEHLGGEVKQEKFAREVRRLGRAYWVQTPSMLFPIECHTGMPFWWFYPRGVRAFFVRRWRKSLPEWAAFIDGTTVLRRRRLQALFPDAEIYVETMFGVPKSYVAYRDGQKQG